MYKVKAHGLDIMCLQRNLDSIVVLSAEVSKFDKMPRHLSPVQLPLMVNDRGRTAEITVTFTFWEIFSASNERLCSPERTLIILPHESLKCT